MRINHKKTKKIPFNFSKKYDFLPQLHFPEYEPLEVIYETRFIGVILTSNLNTSVYLFFSGLCYECYACNPALPFNRTIYI